MKGFGLTAWGLGLSLWGLGFGASGLGFIGVCCWYTQPCTNEGNITALIGGCQGT